MDFHSMIGKLRAIESLGVTKNYVAEEEATTEGSACSMTAEGESCPVHGLNECPMVPMEEGDMDTLKGMLKNSGQMHEDDPMGFGNEWNDGMSSIPTDGDVQDTEPVSRQLPNVQASTGYQIGGMRPEAIPRGMPAAKNTTASTIRGGDTRMGAASTGILPPDTSGGVTRDPSYRPKTAAPSSTAGGARPEGPASGMPAAPKTAAPQSYDDLSFGKAFAAARKAAGGNGGVFMWKGKPYQTTIKGEKGLAWNSPELKKVGGGWPASESMNEEDLNAFGPPGWLASLNKTDLDPAKQGERILKAFNAIQSKRNTQGKVARPGSVAGGDTRMGAASTGAVPGSVAGGDTRMGAASSGNRPGSVAGGDTRMNTAPAGYRYVDTPAGRKLVANTATTDNYATKLAKTKATMDAIAAERGNAPAGYRYVNTPAGRKLVANTTTVTTSENEMGDSIGRIKSLAGIDNSSMSSPEDEFKVDTMSDDMSIEDLMHKYGVSDEVSEDAPLVGAPFTPLGATNNGPEEWGMVVTGGTDVNHFEESVTINSNMDVRDGKVTKSLSINATDEDVDSLAAMLRNAGIGNQVSFVKHEEMCSGCGRPASDCQCDSHSDCGCGSPEGECQCGMALENADHDYGNKENSSEGEPLDTEEYVWDGPHLNQRFGKIGDNTLMAERAISIFKNYSKEYSQVLAEADLEPSNAGFDSPLTANNRDEFDKDPFVDETPVDDGSRSPLSTVKRQDVMN